MIILVLLQGFFVRKKWSDCWSLGPQRAYKASTEILLTFQNITSTMKQWIPLSGEENEAPQWHYQERDVPPNLTKGQDGNLGRLAKDLQQY